MKNWEGELDVTDTTAAVEGYPSVVDGTHHIGEPKDEGSPTGEDAPAGDWADETPYYETNMRASPEFGTVMILVLASAFSAMAFATFRRNRGSREGGKGVVV